MTICSEQVGRDVADKDFHQSTLPPSIPSYPSTRSGTGTFATLGIISAILALFIVPEIFGSAAIILGAYTWKQEQGNRGIAIVILGIVCMLVGIYFTSIFALIDLLPPPPSGSTTA
jgi:hypothetical protein